MSRSFSSRRVSVNCSRTSQCSYFSRFKSSVFVCKADGEIHKISAWKKSKNCWKPDVKRLEKWWQEETNLKNNRWLAVELITPFVIDLAMTYLRLCATTCSWGVNYFDLTQESQASGAEDRIFESEWDCTAANGHSVLSIIKPFKSATKIWDIKLSVSRESVKWFGSGTLSPSYSCKHILL